MRNLEQSVGFHRRLEGQDKSAPHDPVGTFDITLGHSPHIGPRVAVCTVYSPNAGRLVLQITIRQRHKTFCSRRRPIPAELDKLLPLFFHKDEVVQQIVWPYQSKYHSTFEQLQ